MQTNLPASLNFMYNLSYHHIGSDLHSVSLCNNVFKVKKHKSNLQISKNL